MNNTIQQDNPKIVYLKCQGFGDQLFKPLFSALSENEADYIWCADPKRKITKSITTCGSILHLARTGDEVYGSGTLFDNRAPILATDLKIHAIRGPLCRSLLLKKNINCPDIYIDPGVLFAIYFGSKAEIENVNLIGIVPHFEDYAEILKLKLPPNYTVINPSEHPLTVLSKIQRCSKIISSSLHGLIIAEALNIPAAWVEFSDKVLSGGMKFYDYFYGSGRKFQDIFKNNLRTSKDFSSVEYNPPAEYMFEEAVNAAPDWLIHKVQKEFLIEKYNYLNNKGKKIISGLNSQFINWTPIDRQNEIRVDSNRLASDTVFLKMLNSVKNKRGFSLIRVGDGEFACINKALKKPSVNLSSSWRKEVAGGISSNIIDSGELGNNLIKAINNANIVGMSSWDNHHPAWTIPDEIRPTLKKKFTCNTWIFMEWRANGCMDTLLNQCSFAVLNCDAKQYIKQIERNRCLDSRFKTGINEHTAFDFNGNFKEAEEFIKNTNYDVYLISCGPNGKLWVTEMAENYHKVILDVGHSMKRTFIRF